MRFSIWHLLSLMLLVAIYVAIRNELRAAVLILPMLVGAISAWRSKPSFLIRIRAALFPTSLLTIAFLIAEMCGEYWSALTSEEAILLSYTFPSVRIVCFVLALYTCMGLIGGVVVGIAVHSCAHVIRVVALGISASTFLRDMRANQAFNPSRRVCPICKTVPTRRLG